MHCTRSVSARISPPALTNPIYTADFNEIRIMGSIISATRSTEETLYAQFLAKRHRDLVLGTSSVSLSDQRSYSLGDNAVWSKKPNSLKQISVPTPLNRQAD